MASAKDEDESFDRFADELFRFLLPRRINVKDCSRPLEGAEDSPSNFNPDIGMSVLSESWRYQLQFINHFSRNRSVIVKDIESYERFCATYASYLYTQSDGQIFKAFTVIASMVLELGVFCHNLNYPRFKYYGRIFFSCIFKHFLEKDFFSKGGWDSLQDKVSDDAFHYRALNTEVQTSEGRLEIRNDWLRKYDSSVARKEFESIFFSGDAIDFSDEREPFPCDYVYTSDPEEQEQAENSDVVANTLEDFDAEMLSLSNFIENANAKKK